MQREKCRNVVGCLNTKLENDLKTKLEKEDFMKKKNKTKPGQRCLIFSSSENTLRIQGQHS